MMRLIFTAAILVCGITSSMAHHPDRENQPVHPRIDVIGPLGNRLPMSYRRRYNRPTNIGGRIAYYIAPTSQEAMAWHDATHRGLYENHRPRMEMHYFYPKPYEALRMGPRPDPDFDANSKSVLMDAKDEAEDVLQEIDPNVLPDDTIPNVIGPDVTSGNVMNSDFDEVFEAAGQ